MTLRCNPIQQRSILVNKRVPAHPTLIQFIEQADQRIGAIPYGLVEQLRSISCISPTNIAAELVAKVDYVCGGSFEIHGGEFGGAAGAGQ